MLPPPPSHRIVLLGSTGSIGTQTLDVARRFPRELQIEALAAGRNEELLREQIREFRPRFAAISDPTAADRLERDLRGSGTQVVRGPDALSQLAAGGDADLVVAATVGWTGVEPVLAALRAGRDVALANKEVLVCAGELVLAAAREAGRRLLPIDSEHNALWQALEAGPRDAPLRRLVLTCSGGPFRTCPEDIENANAARTLRHPTWDMGRKISVDSATLMNKGFEVIEAYHLFGVPLEKIQVIIHPQSIIHSLVEFVDGSMIAQMGVTDMRLPIQNVLTWPRRLPAPTPPLSLAQVGRLDFFDPDLGRFPCLAMAYEAAALGGTVPCVLNAANEVAVAAHLADRIPCGAIARVLRAVLDRHERREAGDLETLRAADQWARRQAEAVLDEGAALTAPGPSTPRR